jgi:hypothetical protein
LFFLDMFFLINTGKMGYMGPNQEKVGYSTTYQKEKSNAEIF